MTCYHSCIREKVEIESERRGGRTAETKWGSADMPLYLGISCVKGGRGERRGGGRVEKEVESSTTLAGVTLEELEQMLLGKKRRVWGNQFRLF